MKKRVTLFDLVCYVLLGAFALICLYPFYYLIIYSVSIPEEAYSKGVYLLPRGFTLDSYRAVLSRSDIQNGAMISVARTILGTGISVFFTSMLAYVVTKRQYRSFRWLYRITVMTMYFNPGVIPYYITMQSLGLTNTFWIYVIPGAIGAFNMILIRTYMESVPGELEEAALMDGAGPFRIYWQIMLPVCVPIIATVALFCAVGQWNSWYDNFLYVSNSKLKTLQYTLMQYLQQSEKLSKMTSDEMMSFTQSVPLTTSSMRITISMVTTLPILIVYPLVQRYFVQGIMIGSVKG